MAGSDTAVLEALRTPTELADVVRAIAAQPDTWIDHVRLRTDRRWYQRLRSEAGYDVWLITWMPGQGTGFHDHGGSHGAFVVAAGVLEEERPGGNASLVQVGELRSFDAAYAHDVRNPSVAPAISIHAYSPPLTDMTSYELDGDFLVPVDATPTAAGVAASNGADARATAQVAGVDGLLAGARARLHRLLPVEAHAAVVSSGAVLVDIRPAAQRAIEGEIPGALVIERNVLEWRFDPACEYRLPIATSHDVQVIVICSEGYTSSLAAAALQEIGLWRASDVSGGFRAWRDSGLPVAPPVASAR